MGRRAVLVATTILILGVTSSVSAAAPWTDRGWGRLSAKAYQRSDLCANLPGVQRTVPPGYTKDASGACLPPPMPTPTPTARPPNAVPDPQPGFTRVFTDQFDGTALDPAKWLSYTGTFTSSEGCNEPDNLTVGGGVLTQVFAYQGSGVCGAGWYHGSMVVDRAYGGNNQSVTVRFRVLNDDPATTEAYRIIPMRWPSPIDDGPVPPWYLGEADYCEGSSLDGCSTFLHYRDVDTQVVRRHTFDLTRWHTLRATQRPGNDVEIYLDDMAVPVWSYDGNATTVPDVFRRTVLQQECAGTCPTTRTGSERIEVDFVTIDDHR
ncbi:hypothetical protein ACS3YM_12580 [Nocardia sp. N13]|uniref:hypothetical protein n=1 Tax=Nocardioides sp. N13(2025) TaxID=3453405 RepID=UPI003F76F42C